VFLQAERSSARTQHSFSAPQWIRTTDLRLRSKRGALQHVRVANAIRVPEAALAAFLG